MQIASDAENRDERFKPEGGTPTLDPPPKTAYLTWCPPKPSSHSQREEWHSGEDVSCQGDSYRFLISSRPEDRNRDAMDLFSSVKIILPYEYYVKYGGRWPLVRPMVVRDHKRRTGRKRWMHEFTSQRQHSQHLPIELPEPAASGYHVAGKGLRWRASIGGEECQAFHVNDDWWSFQADCTTKWPP